MKVIKLMFAVTLFLLMFPVFLSAQTAAELETVLEADAVTCEQAARFVLASAGSAADSAAAAYEQASANGWLKKTTPQDAITLGQLSFLIMKAFDMKGGMMYRLFPGPRYAYRSMVSRSYIQGAADPAMTVSGERFLLILGRVLSGEGREQ